MARVTSVPIATRVVVAATAASVVKTSRAGRSGGPPGGKKWSKAKSPSYPSSSDERAAARTLLGSPENMGRMRPTLIARRASLMPLS